MAKAVPTRLVRLTKVCDEPGYEWATPRFLRNLVYGDDPKLGNYKLGGVVLIDLDELDAQLSAARRSSS